MAHPFYLALAVMAIDWERLGDLGQGLNAGGHNFGCTPLGGPNKESLNEESPTSKSPTAKSPKQQKDLL